MNPLSMTENSDDDDFLWDCAFTNEKRDRKWIIPDEEDFSTQSGGKQFVCEQYDVLKPRIMNEGGSFASVRVLETRKYQGVFDIIGGEVWEAALLLCSYLILHRDQFVQHGTKVLELGSGIGLPSLFLANMYLSDESVGISSEASLHSSASLFLTLSDFENSLLLNLKTIIESNYHCMSSQSLNEDTSPNPISRNLTLNILRLDWTEFPLPEDYNSIATSDYDFVIGSALCYASFHADCLSRVIKYYLDHNVKEIVIIQIADREGFETLREKLRRMDVNYTVETVPEDCFQLAQRITYQKLSSLTNSSGEAENWFEYHFPVHADSQISNLTKGNLIKTNREAFSLLRIFPNSISK